MGNNRVSTITPIQNRAVSVLLLLFAHFSRQAIGLGKNMSASNVSKTSASVHNLACTRSIRIDFAVSVHKKAI
jgi:hypothetical protein